MAVDSSGRVVIADSGSDCLRLVTGANVAQMVGPAVGALLSAPNGLAAATNGDVWIAATSNNKIRRVECPV